MRLHISVILRLLVACSPAVLWPAHVAADPSSATVVSVRAHATLSTAGHGEEAKVSADVGAGTELSTDAFGRLGVILANQMLLKIAENSRFTYLGMTSTGVSGKLLAGKVWLRGQRQTVPFEVQTPTATAAIRGTEWYMEVGEKGTTTVGVVDGVVEVRNDLGSLELTSREIALVEPGKAPVKLAYVTPPNAVNWTLNYFGLWDERDFKRGGGSFERGSRGVVEAYYRSELREVSRIVREGAKSENSPQYQAARGFFLMVDGKGEEAKQWFERASANDGGWALPIAHLALIALVESDTRRADTLSARAVAIEPDSAVAHIVRAYVLKGTLQLEAAYEESREAVRIAPTFQEAILVAAQIALEMDRVREAEALLEQASDTEPPLSRKRTLEGFLHLRQNRTDDALRDFERALQVEPDAPDALIGFGIALFKQNRSEEAIDSILRAAVTAPQVSDYQSYLAKAYAELGRESDALQVLARAKRLDPKDPTPFLYQALIEQSQFQPGRAFLSLLEARERNDNRAVFRSKYLLDQDRSVLTSNLAQVYHEIGFDHTATQEAARALELDPSNPAAHRRQFFALQFDPRGYAQAASSERLLNNIFLPPTRTAVVVSEDFLSPYQSVFDRPGVDPIIRARGVYSNSDTSESSEIGGMGQLAAQLEQPIAFSVDLGGGSTRSDLAGISRGAEPRLLNEEDDDSDVTGRAFLKWQMTTSTQAFIEFRHQGADRERKGTEARRELARLHKLGVLAQSMPGGSENPPMHDDPPPMSGGGGGGGPGGGGSGGGTMPPETEGSGSQGGEMSPPDEMTNGGSGQGEMPSGGMLPDGMPPDMGMPEMPPGMGGEMPGDMPMDMPPEMPDGSLESAALTQTTDSKISDLDTGLQSKLTPSTDLLLHLSHHSNDDEIGIKRVTTLETLRDTQDTNSDFSIYQAALWQGFGNHAVQIGGRYFTQDFSLDVSEEEEAGAPMRTMNGNDAKLSSMFLVDQYTGIENLTLSGGLNLDALDFELLDGRSTEETEIGPSVGAVWRVTHDSVIRGAVIHNAAGDRNERLQQTLIAGFPWQRLTLIEPYSEEELFHLVYETYVAAYDVYFHDPALFLGVELEHDHQRTEAFVDSGEDERELTINTSERGRLYLETLLTPQWSMGFTYRFDSFEVPSDTYRHGIGFSTAYFTPWKVAFRLNAEYVNLENAAIDTDDGGGDSKVTTISPSIEGYPFFDRMRVNFRTPFNSEGDYGAELNIFCYLNH